jgi:DNA helicase-2/ATP-dependent DNA helicase PcrA
MKVQNSFSVLTSTQLRAATSDLKKSLIILAGPGSGKTLTLTYRIAFMLNQGVDPKTILIATFTRKSANEMKKRLSSLIPVHFDTDQMMIGTFHSCALSLLRANANRAGLTFDFKIASNSKQRKFLQEVLLDYLKENNFEELVVKGVKPLSAEQVSAILEDVGNDEKSENKLPTGSLEYVLSVICKVKIDRNCLKVLNRAFFKVFEAYNQKLKENKMVDMPDLLFLMVELLDSAPDVLEALRNRFKYVVVDEFQDTNSIQLEFLSMIAARASVTVCGDDDQSIYAWRGADFKVFDNFKKTFPQHFQVILNENFRSTKEIVKKSAKLIENNLNREFKDFRTGNQNGCPVDVIISESFRNEIVHVRRFIKAIIDDGGSYRNIAVLYRLRKTGAEFLEYFKEQMVPVRASHDGMLLEKSERKLVFYLKVIVDQMDNEAFNEIVNWPKRKLGDSSRLRIRHTASYDGVSLYQALEKISKQGGKNQKGFLDLYTILSFFIKNLDFLSPFEILLKIINRYELPQPKTLLKLAEKFKEKGKNSILSMIEAVDSSENQEALTLSTIHQAKGQEWDVVFLVRLNEGTLPVSDEIEEERRLAYVGATRAKSRLILSCSMTDSRGENIVPSRFLDEFFAEDQEKRRSPLTPSKELKQLNH